MKIFHRFSAFFTLLFSGKGLIFRRLQKNAVINDTRLRISECEFRIGRDEFHELSWILIAGGLRMKEAGCEKLQGDGYTSGAVEFGMRIRLRQGYGGQVAGPDTSRTGCGVEEKGIKIRIKIKNSRHFGFDLGWEGG
jgi:hypothetical protein